MSGISVFWIHAVDVETFEGDGAYGEVYAAKVSGVIGFLDDEAHLVRTASNQEVASSSVFYTDLANEPLFPTRSRVTANGRVAHVVWVNGNDGGTLGLPSHLEVHLT